MQKKKLLGSALALAMLIPYGPAQAADLMKNLKVDGSIDLQATSANNVSDFNTKTYDQVGDAQWRLMLNAGWDLLDDVHTMVTLRKNDSTWGSKGSTGQPGAVANSAQSLTGTTGGVTGNIFLDQAYIKVDKVFGAIDTTLGSQFYGDAGDMIIYFGPYSNLYGLAVSAIDAARFDWSNDMVGVTGLAGKAKGAALGTANEVGNINVTGINATVKGNDMWNAGAYIWQKTTNMATAGAVAGANDNLWVYGAKAKVSAGPAWLKGEIAKNFGDNRTTGAGPSANYDGWAFKLDLGAKADVGVATLEPYAQFADGSGGASAGAGNNKNFNFTAINPDYRPGGIYGYFSSISQDVLGSATAGTTVGSNSLSDRVVWGVGLKGTPAALNKLTAGVSYWDYRWQSESGLAAAAKGNTHIGSECDVNLTWKHSDNVAFNVGAGQFWSGGFEGNQHAASSPATLLNFTTSVKF